VSHAYESPTGKIVWREPTRPLSEGPPPREINVEGVIFKRSYRAEQAGVPATKGWPIECVASGVHADDAQALRDEFDRVGVPTEVTADGDPVYRSPKHRREALKARGLFDRSAYY